MKLRSFPQITKKGLLAIAILSVFFALQTATSAPSSKKEAAQTGAWQIDYAHSSIGFRVDSRLAAVDGVFHRWKFSGEISEKLEVKGKIIVDVSSIDTRNQKRDDHLRDPDFFEVAKYPTAEFVVERVVPKSSYFLVYGKLRIRDKEKAIKFKLKKVKESPEQIELKSLFVLDRTDFGITYNSVINPMEDEIIMRLYLTLNKKR